MSNYKNPDEVRSKQINLRLTPKLYRETKSLAEQTGNSMNTIVCLCMELQLERIKEEGAKRR